MTFSQFSKRKDKDKIGTFYIAKWSLQNLLRIDITPFDLYSKLILQIHVVRRFLSNTNTESAFSCARARNEHVAAIYGRTIFRHLGCRFSPALIACSTSSRQYELMIERKIDRSRRVPNARLSGVH